MLGSLKNQERNANCSCCKACNASLDFQKILSLKNTGLIIYRHANRKDVVNRTTGVVESSLLTTDDILIFQNTKDTQLTADDCISDIDQQISCPRCRELVERAKKYIRAVSTIDKKDIISVCDHCKQNKRKQYTCIKCCKCKEVFKKNHDDQNKKSTDKEQMNKWLLRAHKLLEKVPSVNTITEPLKFRTHSELNLKNTSHKLKVTPMLESGVRTSKSLISNLVANSKSESALIVLKKKTNIVKHDFTKAKSIMRTTKKSSSSMTSYETLLVMEAKKYKDELNSDPELHLTLTKERELGYKSRIKPGKTGEALKKYSSEADLFRSKLSVNDPVVDKNFSYVFPNASKDEIKPLKKAKTSAELIVDTQEMLRIQASVKLQQEALNNIPAGRKTQKQERTIKSHDEKKLQVGSKNKKSIENKIYENNNLEKNLNTMKKNETEETKSSEKKKSKDRKNHDVVTELPKKEKLKEKQQSTAKEDMKPNITDKNKNEEMKMKGKNTKESKDAKDKTQFDRRKEEKHSVKEEKQINNTKEKHQKKKEEKPEITDKKDEFYTKQKVELAKRKEDKLNITDEKKINKEELHQRDKVTQPQQKPDPFVPAKKMKEDDTKKEGKQLEKNHNNIKEDAQDMRIHNKNDHEMLKAQIILKDPICTKHFKMRRASPDDLILQLIKIKNLAKKGDKNKSHILPEINDLPKLQSIRKLLNCPVCVDSDLALDFENILYEQTQPEISDIIVGNKVLKSKLPLDRKPQPEEMVPIFYKSLFTEETPTNAAPTQIEKLKENVLNPNENKLLPLISQKYADQDLPKGITRYALSDRSFIDKGWTMLPTEKVVRKMNVYRMRPAHPEFDWFDRNKDKKLMLYDTGEKLAEFDENGRGHIFYRNGRLALDYYDAEEINAQQRFVIYGSGEPDERGRYQPIAILGTFDYLGNGVVFDHTGKIRLKYNQTEGVVLDREIGPVSHWKWHTLNDPPVLQQVMIDTQMAHKDPDILKLGGPADDKVRPDNEEMLAIEFDNFIKEKSKKLSQKFKPFQIRTKALKINRNFSLRVLDQANIYLIFRDGTTNIKMNIGMILNHQEIVDTDTAEVGEVSNNLDRFPARTDSLAGLQRSVAYAQRVERCRVERERRLRNRPPSSSADKLISAASRPLKPKLQTMPSSSTVAKDDCYCKCRKPSSLNVYYDTRLF